MKNAKSQGSQWAGWTWTLRYDDFSQGDSLPGVSSCTMVSIFLKNCHMIDFFATHECYNRLYIEKITEGGLYDYHRPEWLPSGH